MQGKVKYFNSDKGYGFISGDTSDVFVHISQVVGQNLRKGDTVSYEMGEGKKGPEAVNVLVLEFSKD